MEPHSPDPPANTIPERSAAADEASFDRLDLLPSFLEGSVTSLIGSISLSSIKDPSLVPEKNGYSMSSIGSGALAGSSRRILDADASMMGPLSAQEIPPEQVPCRRNERSAALVSDEEIQLVVTGRKRLNGYLLVSQVDGFLNSRGTVTQGTSVWRQDVKGIERHSKIAECDIQKEAARIRKKYRDVILDKESLYEAWGEMEPLLMVEEDGEEWKYHPNSHQYYWELTDKFYREASDDAIAKAWAAKPYQKKKPEKPLLEEIAALEEKVGVLSLTPALIDDETFTSRANVVQDMFSLFKTDPALWTARERNVVTVLEKALEELLKKGPKPSKKPRNKRNLDSGGPNDERKTNKKHQGNHPSRQDFPSQSPFLGGGGGSGSGGGGAIGGPQARMLANANMPIPGIESSSIRDTSDSVSDTSTEWEEYGDSDDGGDESGGGGGSTRVAFHDTKSDLTHDTVKKPSVVKKVVQEAPATYESDNEKLTKDFALLGGAGLDPPASSEMGVQSVPVKKESVSSVRKRDDIQSTASMQASARDYQSDERSHGCTDAQDAGAEDKPQGNTNTSPWGSSWAKDAKCIDALGATDQHTLPTLHSTTYGSTLPTQSLDTFDHEQLSEVSRELRLSDAVTNKVICLRSASRAADIASLLYDLMVLARDASNRGKIAEARGIESVVHVMRQNLNNAEVQRNGCWVLRNLAANNSDNQESIAEADGIHCILSAMRRHLNEADLQGKGCAVLKNLSCKSDNQVRVAVAGGIDCVLNAMRQHTVDPSVQEQGCGALRNLSCQDVNKNSIAAAKGINCILNAMRMHSNNALVQEQGCGAIMSLTCNNSDIQETLATEGGIGCILDAMRRYPNDVAVQEKGCGALMNLTCDNSANQSAIAASGGVQCILDAMKTHSSNASIQEKGCKALYNVSFAAETRSILKANGATKVARTAKRSFPDDKKVQMASSQALKKLPWW